MLKISKSSMSFLGDLLLSTLFFCFPALSHPLPPFLSLLFCASKDPFFRLVVRWPQCVFNKFCLTLTLEIRDQDLELGLIGWWQSHGRTSCRPRSLFVPFQAKKARAACNLHPAHNKGWGAWRRAGRIKDQGARSEERVERKCLRCPVSRVLGTLSLGDFWQDRATGPYHRQSAILDLLPVASCTCRTSRLVFVGFSVALLPPYLLPPSCLKLLLLFLLLFGIIFIRCSFLTRLLVNG